MSFYFYNNNAIVQFFPCRTKIYVLFYSYIRYHVSLFFTKKNSSLLRLALVHFSFLFTLITIKATYLNYYGIIIFRTGREVKKKTNNKENSNGHFSLK